jgi:hypothetical protein
LTQLAAFARRRAKPENLREKKAAKIVGGS